MDTINPSPNGSDPSPQPPSADGTGADPTGLTGPFATPPGPPAPSADVSADGLLLMRLAMLVLPLILIVVGYLIYRAKYRIDETFYAQIVKELRERGQLTTDQRLDSQPE